MNTKAEREYMGRVAELGCYLCQHLGFGATPAQVHHLREGQAFKTLLLKHCPAGEPVRAVIEAVGTMGGKNNAIQTQGSLLRTLGAVETVLELLGLKPTYVQPQTWKRAFGLIESRTFGTKATPSQSKAKSLECARRLYPACKEIARAKDHNRAESLLIAHWLLLEVA